MSVMPAIPSILMPGAAHRLSIGVADDSDRTAIYQTRHAVYAGELHQHAKNAAGELRDALDAFNLYLVAKDSDAEPGSGDKIAGFISVTPPGQGSYSIDKYLRREELPFACDDGLYEVRL